MASKKKALGAVGAAAEGKDLTQQGRDMSDTTPTTTATQDLDLFRDWAAQFAASYSAIIIDAQAEDTWDALSRAGLGYDDLCWAHAQIVQWHGPDLPAAIRPTWFARATIGQPIGGEVAIHLCSQADGTDHGAYLEMYYSVRVAPDPTGRHALGDYETAGPHLNWPATHEAIDLDDARDLRDSLAAAIALLEATTQENAR